MEYFNLYVMYVLSTENPAISHRLVVKFFYKDISNQEMFVGIACMSIIVIEISQDGLQSIQILCQWSICALKIL